MSVEEKYTAPISKRLPFGEINTLSPNKLFYYKFKEPVDLHWGLFCCEFAFYTIDDELVYYNAGQYAQCGDSKNGMQFIYYSQSGNIAFFFERHSTKTVHYVIIDLKNKKIFRKQFTTEEEGKIISETFAHNRFADEKGIEFTGGHFQDLQTARIEFEFKNIFGLTSWRPGVVNGE